MSRAARAVTPLTDAQRDEAERHLYLCERAARRYARKYPHVEEGAFLSAAFDGLADAMARLDESRGVMLASYAPKRIAGACVDLVRGGRRKLKGGAEKELSSAHAHPGRAVPFTTLSKYANLYSKYTNLYDVPAPSSGAAVDAQDAFEGLIAGLGPVERFLFRKVYGPDGWTFRQVAAHLGFHASWASQLHQAALIRIAARAACLGLDDGRAPIVSMPSHRRRDRGKPGPRPGSARPVDPATARVRLAALVGVPGDRAGLTDLLGRLKPRQRRAVELRHGLDGEARPRGEVARLLGMTRPGADYAYKAGLEKLRAMANERDSGRDDEHESTGRSLAS